MPKVVTNQGTEHEELTSKIEWISAISRGDTNYKNVLESERVCGKHLLSGTSFMLTGKKRYVEKDFKQVAEKAERVKKR